MSYGCYDVKMKTREGGVDPFFFYYTHFFNSSNKNINWILVLVDFSYSLWPNQWNKNSETTTRKNYIHKIKEKKNNTDTLSYITLQVYYHWFIHETHGKEFVVSKRTSNVSKRSLLVQHQEKWWNWSYVQLVTYYVIISIIVHPTSTPLKFCYMMLKVFFCFNNISTLFLHFHVFFWDVQA